jgi:hypothetical protein
LIIFSSARAFYRQDKAGSVDLIKETAVQNPGVRIRILILLQLILSLKKNIS